MSGKKKLSPSEFARRAADYFAECDRPYSYAACKSCADTAGGDRCIKCGKNKSRPYTLSGLCLALGITKSTFYSLRQNKSYCESVEMAILKIEAYIEEGGVSGDIAGAVALAELKENFGWGEEKASPSVEIVLDGEAGVLAG